MGLIMSKPILFFDADDTLWECNRYFRSIMHKFCDRLALESQVKAEEIYELILKD